MEGLRYTTHRVKLLNVNLHSNGPDKGDSSNGRWGGQNVHLRLQYQKITNENGHMVGVKDLRNPDFQRVVRTS